MTENNNNIDLSTRENILEVLEQKVKERKMKNSRGKKMSTGCPELDALLSTGFTKEEAVNMSRVQLKNSNLTIMVETMDTPPTRETIRDEFAAICNKCLDDYFKFLSSSDSGNLKFNNLKQEIPIRSLTDIIAAAAASSRSCVNNLIASLGNVKTCAKGHLTYEKYVKLRDNVIKFLLYSLDQQIILNNPVSGGTYEQELLRNVYAKLIDTLKPMLSTTTETSTDWDTIFENDLRSFVEATKAFQLTVINQLDSNTTNINKAYQLISGFVNGGWKTYLYGNLYLSKIDSAPSTPDQQRTQQENIDHLVERVHTLLVKSVESHYEMLGILEGWLNH